MKQLNQVLMAASVLLLATSCNGQIKNAKTETVKIFGNCNMCENTIEKAGNKKKIASVDWDENTKMAKISYDSTQTNQEDILKRIALAGYDSDQFLAPADVYNKLPDCCQYERANKAASAKTAIAEDHNKHNHETATETKQEVRQLDAIFENYFAIKNALVKTEGNTASAKAKELLTALSAVKMGKLSTEEHTVWMKVMKDLAFDAGHIEETNDAGHQRDHFTTLSKNMYALLKVSKQETPTYYQNCPMYNDGKGANWLSKENTVKNPYYGSQMLSCGKTVETIN